MTDSAIVVLAIGEADLDTAAEGLLISGAVAVARLRLSSTRALLHASFDDETLASTVVAGLRSAGLAAVRRPLGGGHLAAWQAHTRPVPVTDRLWVCFPWSEFDRDEAPAVVEIDPGRAFGAGGHPSTRLLLVELATRLGGGEDVLDVGCGTGVLAVTAACLGARSVTAIDVDPAAVEATIANAVRNGVAGTVSASCAPISAVDSTFDAIVANIGAATLIDLAGEIRGRMSPGGWLGLSGLSPAQVSVVGAAYPDLRIDSVPRDDDWAAVVAVDADR